MPGYTKINIRRDVEDMAPKFGYSPGLESRFARSALGLRKSGVTLFTLAADYKLPFAHRHRDQEEVYLVLRGGATVVFEDETAELGEWDAIRIPPDVARTLRAGPDGAEVLAFGAGEQGDAELVQDLG